MDKNGILYFVNFFSKDTILPWKNIIIIFLKKTPHKHSYSYNVIIYTDRRLKPTDSVFSDYKNIKEPDVAWLIEAYRKHHTEGGV